MSNLKARPALRSRGRALTLPTHNPVVSTSQESLMQRLQNLIFSNQEIDVALETLDQTQSPLFRLPFEIRQMIWKEVLVVWMIHIIPRKDGHLVHARCKDNNSDVWKMESHKCVLDASIRLGMTIGGDTSQDEPASYPSLLSLLKTCRVMFVTSNSISTGCY